MEYFTFAKSLLLHYQIVQKRKVASGLGPEGPCQLGIQSNSTEAAEEEGFICWLQSPWIETEQPTLHLSISNTMSTVNCLSTAAADSFDYLVVGGGTAGCLVASRLAEYLPKKRILLIEGGPSDLNDQKVADIREWIALLGTEYDYDYPITEQYRGRRIDLIPRPVHSS